MEDLWTGLPRSSAYKQKKLTGWREPDEEGGEPLEIASRISGPDADRLAHLRAFQASSGRERHTVLLGAYHVLVQWLLDDVESLIGCCFEASPEASGPVVSRASYVYAEDDEDIAQVLVEVERQLHTGLALPVDFGNVDTLRARHAPVFFYAGLDAVIADPAATPAAIPFAARHVILASGSDAAAAAWRVSMPGTVARAMDIEMFQRRYDSALSLLMADGARIGDIKAGLGAPSDIPYRQLDEMQRRVIALWAKVLNIDASSLTEDSNYFALGGTSLNAFKLMNRVRVELGRDISIWEIVENPTIQEFSRMLLSVSA